MAARIARRSVLILMLVVAALAALAAGAHADPVRHDTTATALAVPLDGSVQQHLGPALGQWDWFRFEAKAGKAYLVAINAVMGNTADVEAHLTREDGTEIWGGPVTGTHWWTCDADGTVLLGFKRYIGSSYDQVYRFSVREREPLRFQGTVRVQPGGTPVGGGTVSLFSRSVGGYWLEARVATAAVAEDGSYSIQAPRSDSYALLFEPPAGYLGAWNDGQLPVVNWGGGVVWNHVQTMWVREDNSPYAFDGRVYLPGQIAAGATHDDGSLVEGAGFSVYGRNRDYEEYSLVGTATTGADGIGYVGKLDFRVQYRVQPYGTPPRGWIQDYTEIKPTMTAEGTTEIRLPYRRTGRLSGILRDAVTGGPAAGVTVSATNGWWSASAVSAADGSYEIAEARPGTCTVSFSDADGIYQDASRGEVSVPEGGVAAGIDATLKPDRTPPVVTHTIAHKGLGEGEWVRGPATVSLSATDPAGIEEIRYTTVGYWDPGVAYTKPLPLPEGFTFLLYWAVDEFGNRSDMQVLNAYVDSVRPVVTTDAEEAYDEEAVVNVNVSDAGSGARHLAFSINGQPWTQTPDGDPVLQLTVAPQQWGEYRLSYYGQDWAGHRSATRTVEFAVGVGFHELAGRDRVASAIEVSRRLVPKTTDVVFLVGSEAWADAASAASGVRNADDAPRPILLTGPTMLDSRTKAELKRLDPTTVYIMGGTNSVSETVRGEIVRTIDPAARVVRISGADRYRTSVAAANVFRNGAGAPSGNLLVAGDDFNAVMSAAYLASAIDARVLLVPPRATVSQAKSLAGSLKFKAVAGVVGPTTKISDSAARAFLAQGQDRVPFRISATEPQALSLAVTDKAAQHGYVEDWNGMTFARLGTYDMLAAAPFAARERVPLIAIPGDRLGAAAEARVRQHASGITRIAIVGGDASVTPAVRARLSTILKTPYISVR